MRKASSKKSWETDPLSSPLLKCHLDCTIILQERFPGHLAFFQVKPQLGKEQKWDRGLTASYLSFLTIFKNLSLPLGAKLADTKANFLLLSAIISICPLACSPTGVPGVHKLYFVHP